MVTNILLFMTNFMTVADVSEKVGVSPDTVRRWEKSGLIKSQRSDQNYRLFNYSEVERVKMKIGGVGSPNKFMVLKSSDISNFKSIELFTGAGGTALGLENAGFQHLINVEIDKDACKTIRKNRPEWKLISSDIREINFEEWRGLVDVVEGGFPCQSFSYAGKGKGFGDIRGTLFFEFARCIKESLPKIAMGENVKGLLKHDDGKTLATMVKSLKDIGYKVGYRVLRSQYLDVPQKRERLILLAVRNDLNIPLLLPREHDYFISIGDALFNVPQSDGQKYPSRKLEIMKMVPPGGCWRDLPQKVKEEYMGKSLYQGGGKTGMARRLSLDEPCLTLTCAPAQKQTERCHPTETRPLTIREYARIQTFPDDWEFVGSISSRYRQIGNAVPVNLGYHIGRCLIAMLRNAPDFETMEEIKPV